MSIGTHLRLDIRTSYLPSTPIVGLKFFEKRQLFANLPVNWANLPVNSKFSLVKYLYGLLTLKLSSFSNFSSQIFLNEYLFFKGLFAHKNPIHDSDNENFEFTGKLAQFTGKLQQKVFF